MKSLNPFTGAVVLLAAALPALAGTNLWGAKPDQAVADGLQGATADAGIPAAAIKGDGKKGDPKAEKDVLDMFDAIEAGKLEVRMIPKDATEANLLFKNKTKKPLKIRLPEAAAGVHVLAQFGGPGGLGGGMGGGGMGGGGRGGGGMMGGMQGMGMGMMGGMMGMMGGGMGMMGGMMGMMNVEPGKVGRLKVPAVCLEHGKKDPTPRATYKLMPIEKFTKNQEVIEVVKMLGHGQVDQGSAQAAVWHLANGLSWQELAYKDKVRLSNGYREKYFSPQQVFFAIRIAQEAARRARQHPSPARPNNYTSMIQRE